jgi:hypothetical protein
MKKILAIALLALCSFKANEDKKLKVELTLSQWQAVLNQLDNSNSPHSEVKTVTGWLVTQLQPQVKDSTKK